MLCQEHEILVQVIGDLAWIKRLEEGLNNVAEADDEDVKLVDGLRRKGVLRTAIFRLRLVAILIDLEGKIIIIIGVSRPVKALWVASHIGPINLSLRRVLLGAIIRILTSKICNFLCIKKARLTRLLCHIHWSVLNSWLHFTSLMA